MYRPRCGATLKVEEVRGSVVNFKRLVRHSADTRVTQDIWPILDLTLLMPSTVHTSIYSYFSPAWTCMVESTLL